MPATLPTQLEASTELRSRSSDLFALVQDAHLVSLWNTYEEAFQEGYRLFGGEPFSVREFQAYDPGELANA